MGIGSSGVVNCANTYLGTANYTVADGYVADRTVIVDGNGPAQLNLNFARNEVLDPRITFSRTSNATRVNAQGLIEYAPHNLLTYSENFDNAVWTKTSVTVGANIITAPDGTTTADKITYTATSANITQTASSTTATYTISTYVKSSNTSFCHIRVAAITGGSGTAFSSFFNISAGTIAAAGVATADFGSITSNISAAANDWYRISVTFTVLSAATSIQYGIIAAQSSGGASAAGDEIYTWGAQLNIGSLQPYYTTSVKNLLGYSQNFENAAWTKSNSTIDATPVMGPLGFLGAEKLVEDTATNTHLIQQTPTYQAGVIYTHSVYAKAGERTFLQLRTTSTSTFSASFDLVNGTYSQLAANTTAVITSVGNGWFRCSITFTAGASAVGATRIALMQNATTQSYTGDGTSGIYIFGAQLSDSASLDPYSYNFGAAPTSSAYYGPRFDYDPVTLAPKGLLIEEQRINILLNSDTLSTQSVSVTAQAYTLSFYGTGSVALSGAYTGSLVGTGVYPNRVQLTFTPTIGTLTLTVTGSVRYANLEAGSFPTSYIPTTSTQVTRTADNASMVGTNFSSWYNQSEGTLVGEFDMYNATVISGAFPRVISISNGTNANLIDLQSRQYANEDFSITDAAVGQCTITLAQFAANTFGKLAGTYQVNNFQAAANGVLGTADLTGTVPAVNQLQLGNRWDMARPMSGHIKSFKYFNKRLLNTYLQSLTQ